MPTQAILLHCWEKLLQTLDHPLVGWICLAEDRLFWEPPNVVGNDITCLQPLNTGFLPKLRSSRINKSAAFPMSRYIKNHPLAKQFQPNWKMLSCYIVINNKNNNTIRWCSWCTGHGWRCGTSCTRGSWGCAGSEWIVATADTNVLRMQAIVFTPAVVRTVPEVLFDTLTSHVVQPDHPTAVAVTISDHATHVTTQTILSVTSHMHTL